MTDPKGITYTSSSGIWGTVWLECVPLAGSIEDVVPVVLDDRSGFRIEVTVRGQAAAAAAVAQRQQQMVVKVTLKAPTGVAGCADITREQAVADPGAGPTTIELQLAPPCRKLWSPKSPHLYNMTVSLVNMSTGMPLPPIIDTIESYAGLRTYTVGDDGKGIIRPLLNGAFVYQMATLDQGFWPDGNYAAPTDAALRSDLEAHKLLGFNAVRKHQKVETRRWCECHCLCSCSPLLNLALSVSLFFLSSGRRLALFPTDALPITPRRPPRRCARPNGLAGYALLRRRKLPRAAVEYRAKASYAPVDRAVGNVSAITSSCSIQSFICRGLTLVRLSHTASMRVAGWARLNLSERWWRW